MSVEVRPRSCFGLHMVCDMCITSRCSPAGQVVTHQPFLRRLVAWFKGIVALITVFFKTILDPKAADDYVTRRKRSSGGGSAGGKPGGGGGGGGGGPPRPNYRGPRIAGLSDLRDAGGNCAAGA